jgi:hypothetical protein
MAAHHEVKFVPNENRIYVEAYSPLLKQRNLDPKHTHTIDFDFARLVMEPGRSKTQPFTDVQP